MRFCMVTTFFGGHSFGGDAAYVARASAALARRGHEVVVVHCADAFRAVAGQQPLRTVEPTPGVEVHTLNSRAGVLSPLWSHQMGRLGPKRGPLRDVLGSRAFDVVHFHNVSLMGAPELLAADDLAPGAIRLMTAHEYWLVCPMHSLWKYDRENCERPQCVQCTLRGRRPPQWWRRGAALERALDSIDALICPSRHTAEMHRARGISRSIVELPYFVPDGWDSAAVAPASAGSRPYVAAAGRLVRWKGFQELIALFDRLPGLDLRIAGAGPLGPELEALGSERPNVHLLGLLSANDVCALFRRARAVAVPSIGWETFGYVALEAMAVGTPVIARRGGALTEIVEGTGGGLTYVTPDDAVQALGRLGDDDALRAELAAAGRFAAATTYSEQAHVDAYLELVGRLRAAKGYALRVPGPRAPSKDAAPSTTAG